MGFADAAERLAGLTGLLFGWSPDTFWRATPAELGAVVRAASPEAASPPDKDALAALMRRFPDG